MSGYIHRTFAPFAVVALLASSGATPARAQEAAWDRYRADWSASDDSQSVLAGLAGAAAGMGDLPRFQAFLDSVIGGEDAGPNALRYWGAVGLQLGVPPDSVARRFAASLDPTTSAIAVGELVQVLESFDADGAALELLDRAREAGVPTERLMIVRGQLLARSGDRDGAVDAWLFALGSGGDEAVTAAARLGELVADGGEIPAGTVERLAILREATDDDSAGAIVALQIRVHAAEGRWSEALEAAADPVLDAGERGEALRAMARTAREGGEPEAAREALEALVALGPPAAGPEDRLALGEIEDELGDAYAAVATFEAARREGVAGARSRELAAQVEAARASGDPVRIARTLEEASAAGADPSAIAVPLGDLFLSRSRADSALGAYAAAVGEGPVGAAGLEALSRVRLAQALVRSGTAREVVAEVGAALVRAPADPAGASARLADLAERLGDGDSLGVARTLVLASAAEWKGRAGDAKSASEALESAALAASSPGEIPALLLDAGHWARIAGDEDRARRLWREVVEDHANTPYALDARRRLSEGGS